MALGAGDDAVTVTDTHVGIDDCNDSGCPLALATGGGDDTVDVLSIAGESDARPRRRRRHGDRGQRPRTTATRSTPSTRTSAWSAARAPTPSTSTTPPTAPSRLDVDPGCDHRGRPRPGGRQPRDRGVGPRPPRRRGRHRQRPGHRHRCGPHRDPRQRRRRPHRRQLRGRLRRGRDHRPPRWHRRRACTQRCWSTAATGAATSSR